MAEVFASAHRPLPQSLHHHENGLKYLAPSSGPMFSAMDRDTSITAPELVLLISLTAALLLAVGAQWVAHSGVPGAERLFEQLPLHLAGF